MEEERIYLSSLVPEARHMSCGEKLSSTWPLFRMVSFPLGNEIKYGLDNHKVETLHMEAITICEW